MVPDNFPVKAFQQRLIQWWKCKGRSFPWRDSKSPYNHLIAEVLLHRTKADQVVPVYLDFLKKYPSFETISAAPQNEIMEMLFPLGLRWRAECLYHMAREIVEKYGGAVPGAKEDLESLPGISHYIASAVRCFAFGFPEPLLDTNTVRIAGRLFGIPVTDGSRRSKHFKAVMQNLIDRSRPRQFNYAMIDIGALICRPKRPSCHLCPVSDMCIYATKVENDVLKCK